MRWLGCSVTWTRLSIRTRSNCSHWNRVMRSCWLPRCNPAVTVRLGASRCASGCKARPAVLCGRRCPHIRVPRMGTIRSLLFRRRDMNGVDDYFPPTTTTIKSLLFQLVPTRYRAQRYNRQLQREIEANPDGALIVWGRENSTQLYYVFHGMAGGLGIQPLTVLRETGLLRANLVL